jgi:two-component system chemotaxis sensor kinase CheA
MDMDENEEIQQIFLEEAQTILEGLEAGLMELDASGASTELLNKLFRFAHNFKGSSRSVGFGDLAEVAHKAEDVLSALKENRLAPNPDVVKALLDGLDALKSGIAAKRSGTTIDFTAVVTSLVAVLHADKPAKAATNTEELGFGFFDDEPAAKAPTPQPAPVASKAAQTKAAAPQTPQYAADDTIKVPAARLDQLLNLIGELVVNRAILDEHRQKETTSSEAAIRTLNYVSKLIGDVQAIGLSFRLSPIKPLFQKLRRAARDAAANLGKDIDLEFVGEHVELDKSVIDRMSDPLTHMIRNAVDHGVDSKDERAALGKPPRARVVVAAVEQDDRVMITVQDDGRGLDADRILKKAREKNLVRADEKLSTEEIQALIFRAGFSTKEAVTDLSGRGVGLEVVQKAVDELKGQLGIKSELHKGTTFAITLPLSLSIVGGIIVNVDKKRYVVPISQLFETIDIARMQTETVTGKGQMVSLRGTAVPILHLGSLLGTKPKSQAPTVKRPTLITRFQGRMIGVEVDDITNQQPVVLKKLGREFAGLPGIVAGAVLSDGEPGLVLNLQELIHREVG